MSYNLASYYRTCPVCFWSLGRPHYSKGGVREHFHWVEGQTVRWGESKRGRKFRCRGSDLQWSTWAKYQPDHDMARHDEWMRQQTPETLGPELPPKPERPKCVPAWERVERTSPMNLTICECRHASGHHDFQQDGRCLRHGCGCLTFTPSPSKKPVDETFSEVREERDSLLAMYVRGQANTTHERQMMKMALGIDDDHSHTVLLMSVCSELRRFREATEGS